MSQTKNHCEPLVADWLRPSTLEPCICCKQVAEKPRGEHLKMMYVCMYVCKCKGIRISFTKNDANVASLIVKSSCCKREGY